MATEVTQAKTLQERVGERIKEQIGDLLTDADLKLLVETALHDAFFRLPPDNRGHWERNSIPAPVAPIVALVRDLLKERVDAKAREWLAAHSDEINRHVDSAIGEGFSKLFLMWLDKRVADALFGFAEQLKSGMVAR